MKKILSALPLLCAAGAFVLMALPSATLAFGLSPDKTIYREYSYFHLVFFTNALFFPLFAGGATLVSIVFLARFLIWKKGFDTGILWLIPSILLSLLSLIFLGKISWVNFLIPALLLAAAVFEYVCERSWISS